MRFVGDDRPVDLPVLQASKFQAEFFSVGCPASCPLNVKTARSWRGIVTFNVTLLNDANMVVERAERNRANPQSVAGVQGSRRRDELSGLDARSRFHASGQVDR